MLTISVDYFLFYLQSWLTGLNIILIRVDLFLLSHNIGLLPSVLNKQEESNQYLCAKNDNMKPQMLLTYSVVNCFQISIFAPRKTTYYGYNDSYTGCELLSNQYLCAKKDNDYAKMQLTKDVVNCFQISIFAPRKTTCNSISLGVKAL